MNLFRRLEIIFESSLGMLLLAFLLALIILIGVYLLLSLRQRMQDALAYHFRQHYEKAKELTKSLSFEGRHKKGLFGRQTLVKEEDGSYGFCLIPSPDLLDAGTLQRFKRYMRAVEHRSLPLLTTYSWVSTQDVLITLQKDLLRSDGRLLSNLREYCLDRQFGQADAELILLELAKGLAALHECTTDVGEKLYYGCLLPSHVFLSFDESKRIHKMYLSDHGIYFSLGAENLSKRFRGLETKAMKKLIEPEVLELALEEQNFLAPEQKDPSRSHEVGPACDFYAFAAIALTLLSTKPFTSVSKVDWKSIDPRWQTFLRNCLQDSPNERPKDFLELQDRLYDPDIALTHVSTDEEIHLEEEEEMVSLGDLAQVLQNSQAFHNQQEQVQNQEEGELSTLLGFSQQALSREKWMQAKKYLGKAQILDKKHPEVLVSLAIVFYEEGDLSRAQQLYEEIKESHPKVARRFREHIAFRV